MEAWRSELEEENIKKRKHEESRDDVGEEGDRVRRRLDEKQDEEVEMREENEEIGDEMMVEAIWGQEPPWKDESGVLLDEAEVKAAMDVELGNLSKYKVYEEVDESEAQAQFVRDDFA